MPVSAARPRSSSETATLASGISSRLVSGGSITGRVVDRAGAGIPGCQVRAHTPNGALVTRWSETDGGGWFDVGGLTTGSYHLLVSGGTCGIRRADLHFDAGAPSRLTEDASLADPLAVVLGAPTAVSGDLVITQLRNLAPPSISGKARAGELLSADPGTWSPADVSFSYRWYADGVAPAGRDRPVLHAKHRSGWQSHPRSGDRLKGRLCERRQDVRPDRTGGERPLTACRAPAQAVTAENPFVLLLTGAPGAGKSEAMTRVHDSLADAGIDSAAIDVDQLARSYPPIDQDRHLAHLSALSESFRQMGHQLLVVAAAAESNDELRAWLEAAGAERRYVVHLIATPATLERRLLERENLEWSGMPELLESARRLSSVRFDDADLELDTESLARDEVAASIEMQLRLRFRK